MQVNAKGLFAEWFYRCLACMNWVMPKKAYRCVLHSPTERDDGVLACYDELIRRGYEVVVLSQDSNGGVLSKEGRPLAKDSVRGLWSYLTASVVVVTHGIYGNRRPPRSQILVNIWHGEPGGKVAGHFEGVKGIPSTIAPVCSPLGRALRCAMFGLHPCQVPVTGAPRNDRLLVTDRQEARARLYCNSDAAQSFTFLWMPTFRSAIFKGPLVRARTDTDDEVWDQLGESDIRELDRWLERTNGRLFIKTHPHAATPLRESCSNIEVISDYDLHDRGLTTYECLAASDCLITDVSSVWQDYLLLDRPIICMFPDIESYREARGINLEPYEHWIPAPVVETGAQLLEAMKSAAAGVIDRKLLLSAKRRHHLFDDAKSTSRVLGAIDDYRSKSTRSTDGRDRVQAR